MFDSKRLSTFGMQVALAGVTLLLLLAASASHGPTSEAVSRWKELELRQVMRLRVPTLRRPNSAQTSTSRIEQAETEADRTSTAKRLSTDTACLHVPQTPSQPSYWLLPPYTGSAANATLPLHREDVERARAPPADYA